MTDDLDQICECGHRYALHDLDGGGCFSPGCDCKRFHDDLDIPEFLKISQERRRAAWKGFKPHPHHEPTSIERWRRYERARRDEAKEKTKLRIAAFRMSKGLDPFYEC